MDKKLAWLAHVFKKPLFIVGVVVVIIIVIVVVARSGGESEYEFVIAERHDLIQEVSVTGRVKAAESVELAFGRTGTVAQVLADVGDIVTAGQALITLRNGDITALLNQAEVQADGERAKLTELINNADAEQSLTNSYNNVMNTVSDALAKAEDAVRSKSIGVFSGSQAMGYTLTFNACETLKSRAAKTSRLDADLELNQWNKELRNISVSSSQGVLDTALANAQGHLEVIEDFVDNTNGALFTSCAIKNSTLDAARTNMATAQTNITAVINNVNSLTQTIASQKISVANTNSVAAQRAKLNAAEASAQNYRAQLEETIIRSPINGTVTRQDAKTGETVSINTSVVLVMSVAKFEIETHIPEVDIAKVKINDVARVTLDAYGSDVIFTANIANIDPAETIIEGVTTYKTTLQFDTDDDRIRSGMTANLDILTAEQTNVISVPQRAVFKKGESKFVRILLKDDEVTEIPVKTGLRGSDGTIEITSGISEGDKVVTFTP